MKRSEITFAVSQVVFDFFALLAAAFASYSIRFSGLFLTFRPAVSLIPWEKYFSLSLIFVFVWLLVFALSGLYSIGKPKKFLNELGHIVSSSSTGFVVVTIGMFLARDVISSRFVVLAAWALSIVFIAISHGIIRLIRKIVFIFGIGTHRVVLIGDEQAHELIKNFFLNNATGYRLVKFYNFFNEDVARELANLQKDDKIDEVFLINPKVSQSELVRAKEFSHTHHLAFSYSADPFLISHRNLEFSTLAGIPIVELKRSRLDGWGRVLKRGIDFLLALILLVAFSPIILCLLLMVKLSSAGPAIYKNERIGADGRRFNLFKIRTMKSEYSIGQQFKNQDEALRLEEKLINENGIKVGPIYKIVNDSRVTTVGKALRRWSLDELPQLWNVIAGDISLVGPRPHQPREVEKYRDKERKVLNIKPGITGLAQVSGRSDLSFEEEARLDIYYIENWSIWLDLYILIKTPFVVISKKGAY